MATIRSTICCSIRLSRGSSAYWTGSFPRRATRLQALGIPTLDAYVARYCERTGRPPVENPGFYRAYNLFRVAAIIQGIAGRAREGTAATGDAAAQADRVAPIARAAWAEAQAAGAV